MALPKRELKEAMFKSSHNLVDFRRIILGTGPDEVGPAKFHFTWSNMLLKGTEHTAIEGYRESAKTQIVNRSFLLYCLAFPSEERDYIVLIKNNATLAQSKLREIEHEYETNPFFVANRIKVREQSAGVFSVDTFDHNGKEINVRIEAYGKGASIRGLSHLDRRPKIVILDDPQDKEDARSVTVQQSDWEWFLSDVAFLGQYTRIFIIGNNLGENCIIERIFASAGKLEQMKFTTMRVPAINDDGTSAWPEKATIEDILREKEDFRFLGQLDIWLQEKMCQAVGEETRVFDPQDYRYYPHTNIEKILSSCNRIAVLDPASSPEITSCYRAIVVAGCDPDNTWFIADVPFGRWDSAQMIDEIFAAVTRFELKAFGIEKGHFKQVIEPFIYKEMARRNIFFDIIPIEHGKRGSKLERIKMLQPRFKAHKIWFPESASWLAELQSELAGITRDAIKSLYVDLADALAMCEQVMRAPGRREPSRYVSHSLPRQAVAPARLI